MRRRWALMLQQRAHFFDLVRYPIATPSTPSNSSLPPPVPSTPRPSWTNWVVPAVVLVVLGYMQLSAGREQSEPSIGYSDLFQLIAQEKVESATIKGQQISGKLKGPQQVDGKSITAFSSRLPPQDDRDFMPLLREKGVKIQVQSEEQPFYIQALLAVAPLDPDHHGLGVDLAAHTGNVEQRSPGWNDERTDAALRTGRSGRRQV